MYIIKKKGYSADATQIDTGIVDYIRNDEGYSARAVQFDYGRVNYLINFNQYSGATLIDYEPFFEDYNWEDLLMNWEIYRDNWEQEFTL